MLLNLSWVYDPRTRSIALNPQSFAPKTTCLLTISAYGVRIEMGWEIITVGKKKNGAQGNQAICLNLYIKLLSDLRLGHNWILLP